MIFFLSFGSCGDMENRLSECHKFFEICCFLRVLFWSVKRNKQLQLAWSSIVPSVLLSLTSFDPHRFFCSANFQKKKSRNDAHHVTFYAEIEQYECLAFVC